MAAPCVIGFPQVRRAHEILASGELGSVFTARGHGQGGVLPWEGYLSDPSPYFARAGGPLVDMAVYPLHALTGLLGPVREVCALSAKTRDSFDIVEGPFAGRSIPVETARDLVLRLEDGTLASVEADNCASGAFSESASSTSRNQVDGEDRSEAVPHVRSAGPDHVLGIEHLADCVDERVDPSVSVAHARHVIEVLEGAALSA